MERETIGRYQFRQLLGRGGMATVYLALDSRLQREVPTVAALEHPAIVHVHDVGKKNGRLYLVMAYVPGGSLADRLRVGRLQSDKSVELRRGGFRWAHPHIFQL